MTSIIPSPIDVVHIPRWLSTTRDPNTGNFETVEGAPVARKVQSLGQYGRYGSSHEVMGDDVTERIDTRVQMACADPTIYSPSDLVILNPELDASGNWVVGTGDTYWVDGEPYDERVGPWPGLLSIFGGSLKLRRIT